MIGKSQSYIIEDFKSKKLNDSLTSTNYELEFKHAKSSTFKDEENFQKVSYNSHNNQNNNSIDITERNKSCGIKSTLKSIVKSTIELKKEKTSNEKKDSLWKKLKSKMSNFKNSFRYNTLTLNSFFDFYEFEKIKLFNQIYITKIDFKKFCFDFYTVIFMSYRNEFEKISNKILNKEFTTDCGWGCMIRSAQMMLAEGIQKIKFIKNEESIKETILLFADSPLPFEELSENKFFLNIVIKLFNGLVDDTIEVSTDNHWENNKNQEYVSSIALKNEENIQKIKSITPPFSIRNICKLGEYYEKGAGEWFSDVNMINIFQQLNNEFNPVDNMKIIAFNEGVIYNSDLIQNCFKMINHNSENQTNDSNIENICENNSENLSVINFDGKFYNFVNSCVIFVSFRLGLEKISQIYHENIKNIFDIPNNLGIIGGNFNSAHYFIGIADDYLLYLDPHLNQKSWNSMKDFENNFETYLNKKIYKLQIKNLSPGFSVGFYLRNLNDYLKFSNYLKVNSEKSFVKFEEKRKEYDLGEEFEYIENEGDDF